MTIRECYDELGLDFDAVLSRLVNEKLVQKFALKFLDDPSFQNLKDAYPKLPILARTYDRKTTVSLIKKDVDFIVRETFESALTLSHAALMQLGINKIEADEVIAEVRYLDQERLNEEVLHGFSTDIIRKYWMPKPFIKPHSDAEALNEETAEILEKEDDINEEAAVETLLHDDSEKEKQKEVE